MSVVSINGSYEVFLVHSGTEKFTEISTLKQELSPDLKCFLDKQDLNHHDGPTYEQMQAVLETCRHVVVVISEKFLTRRHPCNEFKYASKRGEWIRKQKYLPWESLWVVLYKVSHEDYKQARKEDPSLPEIGIKYFDFASYQDWPTLMKALKGNILEQDRRGAKDKWEKFLKRRVQTSMPRASDVYKKKEE